MLVHWAAHINEDDFGIMISPARSNRSRWECLSVSGPV